MRKNVRFGRIEMTINTTENTLVSRYKELFDKYRFPEWAYRFYPSIPHIGNKVDECNVRCLVYGSAENLTYSRKADEEINRIHEQQWYRHRYFRKYDGTFPHAHIQPINNGSLLIVSRYILSLLGYDKTFSNEPKRFIEEIVVGNFGKFSIDSETNEDYADKYKYLKESIEYVLADILVTKPDIIIMPRKIYYFRGVQSKIVPLLKKGTKIIPIYQTNRLAIGGRSFKTQIDECRTTRTHNYSFETPWLSLISDSRINSQEIHKFLIWLTCKIKDIMVEV